MTKRKKKTIAIIKPYIPIPFANVINTLKHAQEFYDLGYEVRILSIMRFVEERWKFKIKNVHDFYGINWNIKIKYFRGNIIKYFSRLTDGDSRISKLIEFFNPIRILFNLIKKFPKLDNIINPETHISKYCKKNKIDLVYCRNAFIAAQNILNYKIPIIIESHDYNIPDGLRNLISLSKSNYFKGISTVAEALKENFIKNGMPKEKILIFEDVVDIKTFDSIPNNKRTLRKHLNLPQNKKIILSFKKEFKFFCQQLAPFWRNVK